MTSVGGGRCAPYLCARSRVNITAQHKPDCALPELAKHPIGTENPRILGLPKNIRSLGPGKFLILNLRFLC